jgi:uncharacterized membrane protein
MFNQADLVHFHFLLNHFPSVGLLVALAVFVVGLYSKSGDLRRMAMVIMVVIALIGLPAYVTGNVAALAIEKQPGVSKAAIEAHEGLALVSLALLELAGAMAWVGLWQYRRFGRTPRATLGLVLVAGLATFAMMSQASNIGGEIRHPEILMKGAGYSSGIGPVAREFSKSFKSLPWGWAAAETVHFIGLTLIIGVTLLINLRMLGVIKGIAYPTLHRMLPWAILGFTVNTLTGMMFFAASPGNYIPASIELLLLKLAFIVIAGLSALYFTVIDEPWRLAGDAEPSGPLRLFGAVTILAWIGVIYCGSMLPFIGGAF